MNNKEDIKMQDVTSSIPPSGGGGAGILHLLHLSDPTLPIGGFSHSAGLETYVQSGKIKDAETAREFIIQQLQQNLLYTDAALVSLAYDATINNDVERLIYLDNICNAVKLPLEMRQASQKLGMRLMKIFKPLITHTLIDQYSNSIKGNNTCNHYSICFGLLAALMGIDKRETLSGFYYNATAGFVTNSVKLIPLSQQSGQVIMFEMLTVINQLVELTMNPDESMIGICCAGFDVSSMQHERLYSRLYMS